MGLSGALAAGSAGAGAAGVDAGAEELPGAGAEGAETDGEGTGGAGGALGSAGGGGVGSTGGGGSGTGTLTDGTETVGSGTGTWPSACAQEIPAANNATRPAADLTFVRTIPRRHNAEPAPAGTRYAEPSGRVAQRESARFTRGRSLVRSQSRPLIDGAGTCGGGW
jgi:hypothetical protein